MAQEERILKAFADVYAGCTRASIRTMAMQSKNMECMVKHKQMIYSEQDFLNVITEEGIEYNDVISKVFHI
jgi:hypothetical protein